MCELSQKIKAKREKKTRMLLVGRGLVGERLEREREKTGPRKGKKSREEREERTHHQRGKKS